jgi:hypothetical protein
MAVQASEHVLQIEMVSERRITLDVLEPAFSGFPQKEQYSFSPPEY